MVVWFLRRRLMVHTCEQSFQRLSLSPIGCRKMMCMVHSCREQYQSRLQALQRLLRSSPQVSLRQLSARLQARAATGEANRRIPSSLLNPLAQGMRSNLEHGNLQAPDSTSPACCSSWGDNNDRASCNNAEALSHHILSHHTTLLPLTNITCRVQLHASSFIILCWTWNPIISDFSRLSEGACI